MIRSIRRFIAFAGLGAACETRVKRGVLGGSPVVAVSGSALLLGSCWRAAA